MGYAGPILIVVSTLFFIIIGYPLWACLMFTVGVLMLTLNRFIGNESDFGRSRNRRMSMSVRRLYRQRCVGTVVLFLSVAILLMHEGFYYGIYLRKINWLLPFIIFVIIELYSAFRLPNIEKNTLRGKNNV